MQPLKYEWRQRGGGRDRERPIKFQVEIAEVDAARVRKDKHVAQQACARRWRRSQQREAQEMREHTQNAKGVAWQASSRHGVEEPYHEEPPSRSWRALTGAAAHRTSQSERLLRASASRARPARPAKKSIVPFSSGTRGPPILACTHQVLLSFCPSPGVPLQRLPSGAVSRKSARTAGPRRATFRFLHGRPRLLSSKMHCKPSRSHRLHASVPAQPSASSHLTLEVAGKARVSVGGFFSIADLIAAEPVGSTLMLTLQSTLQAAFSASASTRVRGFVCGLHGCTLCTHRCKVGVMCLINHGDQSRRLYVIHSSPNDHPHLRRVRSGIFPVGIYIGTGFPLSHLPVFRLDPS